MQDIKKVIASNIQELRKNSNVSQIELAEQLNYTDKAVSKWERGESLPDIVTIKKIADFFGVTVDYLLEQEHKHEAHNQIQIKRIKTNRFIISALATMLVWLIATVVFVALGLSNVQIPDVWMSFVYAVPASLIVMLVFNSIWGKKKFNFAIITLLVWSFLITLYLAFVSYVGNNIWLVFIIGVPSQIIILLWSRLKIK